MVSWVPLSGTFVRVSSCDFFLLEDRMWWVKAGMGICKQKSATVCPQLSWAAFTHKKPYFASKVEHAEPGGVVRREVGEVMRQNRPNGQNPYIKGHPPSRYTSSPSLNTVHTQQKSTDGPKIIRTRFRGIRYYSFRRFAEIVLCYSSFYCSFALGLYVFKSTCSAYTIWGFLDPQGYKPHEP